MSDGVARPAEPAFWMATALRNGARIEAAAVRTHLRLREVIPSEFVERLEEARREELEHAQIESDLADALWPGDVPRGVGGDQMGWLGGSSDVTWNLTVLNVVERAFRWRLAAFGRRARALGFPRVYDGAMTIVDDEVRHIQLVVDLFRAGECPSPRMIRHVAQALRVIERGDATMFAEAPRRLGLAPNDDLMTRSAFRLIDQLDERPRARRRSPSA